MSSAERRLGPATWLPRPTVRHSGLDGGSHAHNSFGTSGILALQRLFVLMQETRRSFLHITEIAAALRIQEGDYKFTAAWVGAIGGASSRSHRVDSDADKVEPTALHQQLVSDYLECENARLGAVIFHHPEVPEEEIEAQKEAAAQYAFSFPSFGSAADLFRLRADSSWQLDAACPTTNSSAGPCHRSTSKTTAVPCAGSLFFCSSPHSLSGLQMFNFETLSDLPEGDTLLSALDRSLAPDDELNLISRAPETLAFRFSPSSTAVESLAKFGQGASKKKPLKLEEEIWLDRFMLGNRKEIAEGRRQIGELKKEREGIEHKRAKLSLTKVRICRRRLEGGEC